MACEARRLTKRDMTLDLKRMELAPQPEYDTKAPAARSPPADGRRRVGSLIGKERERRSGRPFFGQSRWTFS
jgi:hypothetical protein